MNLFIYGTLLDTDIAQKVCGSDLSGEAAILPEYRCYRLVGEMYPGIWPDSSGTVRGRLCQQVAAETLFLLDRYEGDQYERKDVVVVTGDKRKVNAQVYVLVSTDIHELSDEEWCYDNFVTKDKDAYLQQLGDCRTLHESAAKSSDRTIFPTS